MLFTPPTASELPKAFKPNFSKSEEEKRKAKDAKKLWKLSMVNYYGSNWKQERNIPDATYN